MNTAVFALALMSATTTTTTTTTTTPAQAVMRDFRCYVRRRVDRDFADVLTPKQRRLIREIINRAVR